jgi:hypothetical protein
MFVRWKRRPAKRVKSWSPPNEQAWYAVLVESRRVDGKPRQRAVRHLGSIREGDFSMPMTVDRFWKHVDAELAAVGVTGAVLEAAESKVASVVPRPDPEALAAVQREFNAWKGGLEALAQRGRALRVT